MRLIGILYGLIAEKQATVDSLPRSHRVNITRHSRFVVMQIMNIEIPE